MSILGAIANPQMADIAGALDVRQQRIDRDEAKRREIRMGQLIAEALPNITPGSPLHEMALNNPREFSAFAKATGVPLNDGERMQQFANDTGMLYTLAQDDPRAAFDYAMQLSEQRKASGLDTAQIDRFIEGMREDPQRTMTGLFLTYRSLNRDDAIKDRQLDLQERGLDIQESRLSQGNTVEPTAKQKEWEEYQRLKQEDPEAASQFARATGFETREGQTLSAFAEKQIDGAFNEYTEASGNVSRYSGLAENIRKAGMTAGRGARWTEMVKEFTGNQDEVTALRKEALAISNSEAIKNLPPGPATDRDIEIVMAPFPKEDANPEYIANWLGAMSRLNQKRAEYAEFKADFIASNGSVRNRQGQSLISAWKDVQRAEESMQGGSGQGSATTGITQDSAEPSLDELLERYK